MRKIGLFALAATLGAVAFGTPALSQRTQGDSAQTTGPIAGQYICVFDSNVIRRGQVDATANRAAAAHGGQVLRTYSHSIHGFALRASATAIANMQRANPFSVIACRIA